MYFTVKATYRSETRKFVYTNSSEFPSYHALQDQLLRVFPISHNVYLSKLLFSPNGDNNARLLIGVEVHSEDEYETHVKPYRGKQWPGALLRFSVFDEAPHKVPSVLKTSTEETNTVTGTGSDAQPPVLDITSGPEVPEGRRALRSLLDSRSSTAYSGRLHWPDLEQCAPGARELPHPPAFHPAKHPYYGFGNSPDVSPSPWRWLPPPPPIPASATPRAQNIAVPPPPPAVHSLRPAASMSVLRESELPPPPPPRPRMADFTTLFSAPPPVPARPDESPESSCLAQGHLLQRLARRSRPEPDVEQHPMNANRHSWAGGVPSKAQSLDEYLRESNERGAAETSALARLFTTALDKRDALQRRATEANLAASSELLERRCVALLAAQRQLREKQEQLARNKRVKSDWDLWSFDDIKAIDENKENVAESKKSAASVPVGMPSTFTTNTKDDHKSKSIVIEADSSDEVEIPVCVDKGKRAAHRVKFTPNIEDKTEGNTPENPIGQPARLAVPPTTVTSYWSPFIPGSSGSSRKADLLEDVFSRRRHMPRKSVPSVLTGDVDAVDKDESSEALISSMQSSIRRLIDHVDKLSKIEAKRKQEQQATAGAETGSTPAPEPVASAAPAPVTVEAPKVVHTNVRCDICDKTIEGVRHKCLDCPDYDLCTPCLTATRTNKAETIKAGEAHVLGGHQSNHIFPIEEADDVWLHTVFKGADTELPSGGPVERTGIALAAALPEELANHHATCNLCDSGIVGSRFKCLNCPDWDVCALCFTIVGEQHPGHGFVEVKDPASLKQYRSVLGLSRAKMHHASCDACKEMIRGIRYKCMHPECADYDLCEHCEALPHPVHPPTHAFLKLRSPDLPISLFRAPPAPAYVPPMPPAPVAPAPRLPTPPSFLPVLQTTSPESADERIASEAIKLMPGGLRLSSVIPARTQSPPAIEAIANKEPLVVPTSENESPYATPSRTPVFPEVPTEAPRASSANEVERMIAYARDAIAQADEVTHSHEEPISVVDEPEEMKTEEVQEPTTGTKTDTGTPSVQSHLGLPRVQTTEFTDLFDLAVQYSARYRHIRAQTPSAGARTPPVTSPTIQAQPQQIPAPVKVEVQQVEFVQTTVQKEAQPQVEMMQRESEALPSIPSSMSIPSYSMDSPSENVAPAQPSPLSTHSLLASPPPVIPPAVRSFVQPSRFEPVRRSGTLPEADSRPTSLLVSDASCPLSMVTDNASTVVSAPAPLRAVFVADNNIPDGQVFPPGAEFVKSWAMMNDGPAPWPASTELLFVAGDRLGIKGNRFKVGHVMPGEEIDVWTGEMKAPEVPGKYISYWRLDDGQGNRFGHSIWVDIVVEENNSGGSSESSMAASSIIMMPQPASTGAASVPAGQDETTTASVSAAAHDDDVDSQSSVSFLDVPGLRSPSDEFVVLYDSSDDEEML